MRERSVSAVPTLILSTLAIALVLQVGLRTTEPAPYARAQDLSSAPSPTAVRLASLGEASAAAKLLMLYVQAIDYRSGNPIPYQKLDYDRLQDWLRRILELDPAGQYPLLAASRIYAEIPDPVKQRQMLEFVYRQFFVDPNHRWPWLAHAAVLAKHRLHDLPLALRYAEALERFATADNVPAWARQMRAFILEDMNELQAARLVIGGYIKSGKVTDPAELRFLEDRLRELEVRLGKRK
jgi:hypothetical protein